MYVCWLLEESLPFVLCQRGALACVGVFISLASLNPHYLTETAEGRRWLCQLTVPGTFRCILVGESMVGLAVQGGRNV